MFGLVLAMSLVGLGLSGWCFRSMRGLEAELAQRPQLAVIPVNAVLRKASESSETGAVDRAAMRLRTAGQHLRAQGYLVLDADQLVAYPKAIEARPDVGSDDAAGDDSQ